MCEKCMERCAKAGFDAYEDDEEWAPSRRSKWKWSKWKWKQIARAVLAEGRLSECPAAVEATIASFDDYEAAGSVRCALRAAEAAMLGKDKDDVR